VYFSDIEAFGSASVFTMWCDDDIGT